MLLNSHDSDGIKIEFDLSKFKCELSLKSGFVLDFTHFGNLIVFEVKVYDINSKLKNTTYSGTKMHNIERKT